MDQAELISQLRNLLSQGEAACLNGHRANAEELLDIWIELPMEEGCELSRLGHELWDLLDPPDAPAEPPQIDPDQWLAKTELLLLEHWGDLAAFEHDEGAAANRASWQLMEFDLMDRSVEALGEERIWIVYLLWGALLDHYDPDRITQAYSFEKYGRGKPERSEPETLQAFKERLAWFRAGRPAKAGEMRAQGLERVELTYTQLRETIFAAAIGQDEDGYNAGLGEMAQRFRKDERKLLPELLRLLRQKYSERSYRTGEIDIRKCNPLGYALEGFLPEGEVVHLFAPWFTGKTALALGMAGALIRGEGFLDVEIASAPRKVLFIQTDAGAARFAIECEKQDLLEDPRFVPGAEQMLYVWAPDDEQGVEAWSATFRGLVKLREEAQRLGVGAIFIDSVKGMMSGTGMDYTHNETVNQFVTLLRQTVAMPLKLPVVLLNHKGTDQKEGAGAKAWSEACGAVVELLKVERDKVEQTNLRELVIRKDSIGGPRRFVYTLQDSQLKVVEGASLIKDGSDLVLSTLKAWFDGGKKQFTRSDLLHPTNGLITTISRASIDRALDRLCTKGGPVKKVRRGVYELKAG